MSAAVSTCPKCGQAVPADAPAGLCPRCLVAGGFTGTQLAATVADESDSKATLHIVIPQDAALPSGAPRQFGKYQLLEEIARGGMGVVYKARHTGLDSVVAVKLIRSGVLATPTDVERFQREAKTAAKLRHPNIVTIHDIGEQDGQHYFSMDYVAGANLAELARTRPFSPKQAAEIVAGVASAIHFAHEQGVLHRDLKPANVILTPEQQPRVLDFGLARHAQDDSQLTQSGTPMGSPSYMPPEQAAGRMRATDARSDVYALGAMLYELVTGRPPFQAASVLETLKMVLETEPASPRLVNPNVPPDLETICLKCLEKTPAKRYATAQALAEELGRFLRDEPIKARPVSAPEKLWRWCRRKPALASSLAVAGLLLLIVAIGSPIVAVRIKHAAGELRRNLYVADMNNASAALQQRQFGRVRELLEPYLTRVPGQEDLRGIEWRFLWQQCQPDYDFSFAGHSNAVTCAVFSADGAWLATASRDRTVQVWDRKSRQRIRTLTGFDDFIDLKALAFSPDSKLLVAKGGDRLRGWRVGDWTEGGLPLRVQPNWNDNNAVAFSTDGLTLATRMPGGVGFVDVPNWRTNDVFLKDTNLFNSSLSLGTVLTYSHDGRFLILSDWHMLLIRDARSPLRAITTLTRKDGNHAMRVYAVAVSKNLLAAGFRDGVVTLWDMNDWHEIASFQAQSSFLYDLVFSPDATLLASCGEEHSVQLWHVEDILRGSTSAELPQSVLLRGHTRAVNSLMFAPGAEGRTLLSSSADKTVKLWDLSLSLAGGSLPGSARPIWFSQDGRQILIAHTNSQLHLWDLDKNLDLGQDGSPVQADDVLAVSPDGELVAVTPRLSRLEIRDFRTGKPVREVEMPGSAFVRAGFAGRVTERRMAFAAIEGRVVSYWLWDVDSGKEPVRVGAGSGITPDKPVPVFALSHDGNILALGNANGGILLHHVATHQSRILPADNEDFFSLAISRDGALLAAGRSRNSAVRFWDTQSGHELPSLAQPDAGVAVIEFSADGKSLITCDLDGDVRFWSVALHKELMSVPNHNPMEYFFLLSPDNSVLAMPSPKALAKRGAVSVWRAPSFDEIHQQEAKRGRSL